MLCNWAMLYDNKPCFMIGQLSPLYLTSVDSSLWRDTLCVAILVHWWGMPTCPHFIFFSFFFFILPTFYSITSYSLKGELASKMEHLTSHVKSFSLTYLNSRTILVTWLKPINESCRFRLTLIVVHQTHLDWFLCLMELYSGS